MTKPRWKNPDKRMARAVELRAQGWSLRRIGTELAVTESTIRVDLARWKAQQDTQNESCPVIALRDRSAITQAQSRSNHASAITQGEEQGA